MRDILAPRACSITKSFQKNKDHLLKTELINKRTAASGLSRYPLWLFFAVELKIPQKCQVKYDTRSCLHEWVHVCAHDTI